MAAVRAAAQELLGAPSDVVHELMRQRVRSCGRRRRRGLNEGEQGAGLGLGSEAMGRRAAEGTWRLGPLLEVLILEVHLAHYTRIIAEEAAVLLSGRLPGSSCQSCFEEQIRTLPGWISNSATIFEDI